jgi:diguanylate cyclase (GGDEF)-like protein
LRASGEWLDALQILLTGLLFIVLFSLGCYVGLATRWPALIAALTPESQFLTRTGAVLLAVAVAALVVLRIQSLQQGRQARRAEKLLQDLLQASAAAEERALRVASQKALLLSLKFTDRLEHARQSLLEECEKLEAENTNLRSSLTGLLGKLEKHDPSETKLETLPGFETKLAECLARPKGVPPFCLLMAAVDDLQMLHDSYGQAAADIVFKGVAAILRRALKAPELVASIREGEFALIFLEGGQEACRRFAERVRLEIREAKWRIGPESARVTATFSVVEARPPEAVAALLSRARQVLESARSNGHNRVVASQDEAKA